jgi:hypothetical protein
LSQLGFYHFVKAQLVLKSRRKDVNFNIKAFQSLIIGSCFLIKTIVDLGQPENQVPKEGWFVLKELP